MLEREAAAAAEAAEGAGATVKLKPMLKQAVTELLRSFGSFNKLEVKGVVCHTSVVSCRLIPVFSYFWRRFLLLKIKARRLLNFQQ